MSDWILEILIFIIKMCIGLAIALGSVILGVYLLKFAVKFKYNFELNVKGNLKIGNISMAMLIGAIALAITIIAEVGFSRIFSLQPEVLGTKFIQHFILIEISILIAIFIALLLVLLALIFIDNLLKDMELLMEVKDGNIAISIIFSIIILIIGIVGRVFTSGLIQLLETYFGF